VNKNKKQRTCRSPSAPKEVLNEKEIRELMRHDAYIRSSSGRMRSRQGRFILK
jgi:hypothetical protein